MTGDHDAASTVGRQAGLGEPGQAKGRLRPAELVTRFCGEEARGLRSDPGTVQESGYKVNRGWCGFNGTRSDDPLISGFDDGYEFMGALAERGWRELPAKGDWPLVVYMAWVDPVSAKRALAEYCEADLTVWEFDTEEAFKRVYATLRDCP